MAIDIINEHKSAKIEARVYPTDKARWEQKWASSFETHRIPSLAVWLLAMADLAIEAGAELEAE